MVCPNHTHHFQNEFETTSQYDQLNLEEEEEKEKVTSKAVVSPIYFDTRGWEICTIFELPLDVMLRGHKTSNYKCSLPSRPIHGFCTFFLSIGF